MKIFRSTFFLVTLIQLSAINSYGLADEVVILGNESMPFNGIVDNKNAGMTFEILEAATLHGAPKFSYKLGLPWKRAQKKILHEKNDTPTAIVPFTRTPEREDKHFWIAKLISYQTRLSSTDRSTTLQIDNLKDKPIGIIRGSAHIPFLKELGLTRLSEVTSAVQNAKKLYAGHIYAIAESQFVDTYHWKSLGHSVQDLQFLEIGEPKHIYIAGNPDFPKSLAMRISEAVETMRQNGELRKILEKWEN